MIVVVIFHTVLLRTTSKYISKNSSYSFLKTHLLGHGSSMRPEFIQMTSLVSAFVRY